MRNQNDFWGKLNFPVTGTRHVPVTAHIIACSGEDLPHMTTKVAQTIHIYSTVSFCMKIIKVNTQTKTLNYTWAPFVKPGKYACHVFQKFDSHGELVGE